MRLMNKYYPRIPTIIASKAKEAEDLKELAFILPGKPPEKRDTAYQKDTLGHRQSQNIRPQRSEGRSLQGGSG